MNAERFRAMKLNFSDGSSTMMITLEDNDVLNTFELQSDTQHIQFVKVNCGIQSCWGECCAIVVSTGGMESSARGFEKGCAHRQRSSEARVTCRAACHNGGGAHAGSDQTATCQTRTRQTRTG